MSDGREIRIAAVGDLHYDATHGTSFREMFSAVNREADILLLCGDMTTACGIAITDKSISAEMPPIAQMSGFRMSAARAIRHPANCSFV